MNALVAETSEEDTINLELSAADLLRLAQVAEQAHPEAEQVAVATESLPAVAIVSAVKETNSYGGDITRTPLVTQSHTASLFGLAVAAMCVGSALYLSTSPDKPASLLVETAKAAGAAAVSAAQAIAPTSPTEIQAVRFSNPFDAEEVFEFPPGTSETEARDAVAKLLLQRAEDRLSSSSKAKRDAADIARKNTTASVPSVEQRG